MRVGETQWWWLCVVHHVQEIAMEVALAARQNTWIDGSLKDHDFYGKNIIPAIRHRADPPATPHGAAA